MAPKSRSVTMRAGWLAARFRQLRKTSGLSGQEVGDYLGKTQGTVSKLESGEFPISGDTLLQLMDLYGVNDLKERGELLRLSEEVAQRGWWDGYASVLGDFADYVWLESTAAKMSLLDINNVPGLLQTPEYAAALIGRGPQSDQGDLQIRRLTEARMMRRQQLDKTHPPEVRFLVHEVALRQAVGAGGVMEAQLEYLLTAFERPNIKVRVIPLSAWMHTAVTVGGGFTIFELPAPFPDVTCVETPAGAIYVESPDIGFFRDSYDAIWEDALSSEASQALIAQLAKDAT